MIASIAHQFHAILQDAIAKNATEPLMVKDFVGRVIGVGMPPRYTVESRFIHQRPYAFFVNLADICGRKKTELGDVLLIVKRLRGKSVIDHRFVTMQAKRLTNGAAAIDVHQFQFLRDLKDIEFRFGNSVHKQAGIAPIVWKKVTSSLWFGSYLFLDQFLSLVSKVTLVDSCYPGGCSPFPYSPAAVPHLPWGGSPVGLYAFEAFIVSFLQKGGLGVKVSGKPKALLELVLKRVGMVVDPPEENQGFWEDSDRDGFGVVRVTIQEEEERG